MRLREKKKPGCIQVKTLQNEDKLILFSTEK